MRPLLEDNSTIRMFENCVGLKVPTYPGLPRNICGTCYGKCSSWNKFKQQCLETDALLQFKFGLLQKTKQDEADPETNEQKSTGSNDGEPLPEPLVEEVKEQEEYEIVEPGEKEDSVGELQENGEGNLNQEIEIEVTDQYEVKETALEGEPEEYEVKEAILEEFYLSGDDQILDDLGEDVQVEIVAEEIVSEENGEQQTTRKRTDYNCDKCSMRFRSKERFEAHQREHQGLKPEVCKVCNNEFNSTRALWRHMQKHADIKKHACKDCGRRYKYATSLTLHRKSHRNERLHVCETCGKSFFRAHGLKSHLLTHTKETPFECDKCQKQFKNTTMLRNHVIRVHEGTKNFICSECSKAFATGAELKIHQRSHTNQKPFKCSVCDKCYKTQSHLAVHFRAAHTSNRPYACDLCPRTFAHSKVLKQHRFTHATEGPYKCNVCEQTFRQKKTLIGHMSKHERMSPDQEFVDESVINLPQTINTLE